MDQLDSVRRVRDEAIDLLRDLYEAWEGRGDWEGEKRHRLDAAVRRFLKDCGEL